MQSQIYTKTYFDLWVYFKRFSDNNFIIYLLYVDDMLIIGKDKELIDKLKSDFSKSFDKKDLVQHNQFWEWRSFEKEQAESCYLRRSTLNMDLAVSTWRVLKLFTYLLYFIES